MKENKKMFMIPKGFAHGFLVLSEEAEFTYKCDDIYNHEAEGGLKFDDPDVRYYACVVDKNRAGAKPKVLLRLNLAYNEWEELGYLRLKTKN